MVSVGVAREGRKTVRTTRRGALSLVGSMMLTPWGSVHAVCRQKGRYQGRVVAEWLPNREMKLIQPFEYIGSDGLRWPVPAGAVVDGASIPQFLWSMIGGPFEGKYREASVIHDYFCETRTRRSRDVHQMFHEAMLTSGVSEARSWIMYQGVDQFGPRWQDPNVPPECQIHGADRRICPRRMAKPTVSQEVVTKQELDAFIKRNEAKADPADIATLRKTLRSM